jgi:chromosome segregation ATPase
MEKALTETSAGSVHSQEVERALAGYKKEIADLTAEMADLKESNKVTKQELEKELAELRSSLARREREQAELKKGLDEERGLRKQLETSADELRAQFLRRPEIQSLSKDEQAKKLQEFQEATRDAIDRALREARKRPLRRRLMEIAEDIPFPNFIGKPILGGLGICFDVIKTMLR